MSELRRRAGGPCLATVMVGQDHVFGNRIEDGGNMEPRCLAILVGRALVDSNNRAGGRSVDVAEKGGRSFRIGYSLGPPMHFGVTR